jgi:hypothetical protein
MAEASHYPMQSRSAEPDGASDRQNLTLRSLSQFALELLRIARVAHVTTSEERRLAWQAKFLYLANNNDSLGVQGALLSAAVELAARNLPDAASLTKKATDDIRAEELIHLACNRARNEQRRQQRIRSQVASSEVVTSEGRASAIDQFAGGSGIIPEIDAQIGDFVGYICRGLDERDKKILELAATGLTQTQVALQIPCNRTTVSRVLSRIRDRFDRAIERT